MKRRVTAILCALAVFVTAPVTVPNMEAKASENVTTGTTYYVSSIHGDNSNRGTSSDEAWQTLDKLESVVGSLQPGDQILLEKGSVFHGYIHLKDVHGTEANPIKISSYGEGTQPIINGGGQGIWYQDYGKNLDNANHRRNGYVSSTVLLYDVDYVEVSDLEITNQAESVEDFSENDNYFVVADKIAERMDRTGVAGIAKDGGTMQGITLSNLYIHEVDGNIQDKHMNNGGIQMNALKPTDETATGIARYQDVLIENCYVENVSRAGIVVGYTYNCDKFHGAAIADETVETYGHGNIVFRNNYVKDAGNDAIVVMYADSPLVENNVSDGAGADIKDYENFWQRFCCAIWPWKCKDAVFQGNEAFDTVLSQDGHAWDIDSSDGTIYQYNYSHNNGGGALLVCLEEAYNGIFRYNISYNDLRNLVTLSGNPEAKIYNNVFYIDGDLTTRVLDATYNTGVGYFANNIFYNASTANPNDAWQSNTNATYTNNLYYGYDATPASDTAAVVVTDGSTIFADRNALNVSMLADGSTHDKSAFNGYKLADNSPAINAGTFVASTVDFFGNVVGGLPDIGIHEKDVQEYAEYDVTGMTAVAGSDEGEVAGTSTDKSVEGPAALVLDNDTTTIWHSKWAGDSADNLWITIDMGEAKNVSMLKYVPRPGVNDGDLDGDLTNDNANGVIKQYKIYTSTDNSTWTEVNLLNGDTWAGDGTTKHAYFETVNARYVKLQTVTSISKNEGLIFATAAEIRLGYELGEEE